MPYKTQHSPSMTTLSTPLAASGLESHYVPVCSRRINGRLAAAWSSAELEDSNWDDFLEATPLGHFQQSSLWARAKDIDGWRPLRTILTLDGQIAGGFQILTRHTRFGLIGYVSKGPVLIKEEDGLLDFMMELVVSAVKANQLKALILQPPDPSTIDDLILTRHRFLPNHLVNVVSATLLTDLSCGMDQIERRMRKNTLVEVRQACRRGIKVRQGGELDVGTFFRLMRITCERQQTKPAPATESALLAVWEAFNRRGCVHLFLAEYEGAAVAGTFCLCFGDRVTIWKKGWSGQHRERHPNQLLLFKTIEWAQQHGYKLFDFAGLNPEIAAALLRGETLSEIQRKSRDFVHLSYGNLPMLLPESQIYINNPLFQFAYRGVMASCYGRTLAKGLIRTCIDGLAHVDLEISAC